MTPRLSLPLPEWSEADQAALALALQPPAFLEEPSRFNRWSRRRREAALLDAGRFLAWCRATGALPEGFSGGLTATALSGFIQFELDRGLRHSSMVTAVLNVIGVGRSISPSLSARDFWPLLKRLRVASEARPRPARRIIHPVELYQLGLTLMEGALSVDGVHDLELWQDGLMVALLTAAPMRIANFAALQVGKHVRQVGSGWLIDLGATETKTREPDQWPVPQGLAPYLSHHLEAVRPAMLARRKAKDTGALWLGAYGQDLGHQGVRKRVKQRTAAAFGRPILPHSFRHAAATTFALAHPERPREAAALLGHAGPAVTEKHYILSKRHLALHQLHRMLDRRRAATAEGE